VWAYLHLPVLRRGILERPGLVPIARRWDSRRDMHTLSNQLAALQDAINSYPQLDVVWRPYLDEGQPWLVQDRPYFGRSVWVHALNLVLPIHLYLCQRLLGLLSVLWSSPVETGCRGLVGVSGDYTTLPTGPSEQRSRFKTRSAEANDAYLQAFPLKYGAKVYKGARRQVDMTGETVSLRALLYLAVQDREIVQREVEQLDCGSCRGHWLVAGVVVAAVAGRVVETTVVVAGIVVIVAVVAFATAAAVFDPLRDLVILALILLRVLALRRRLSIVPGLMGLLIKECPTYQALRVIHCTYLLIGLDSLSNRSLGLLGIAGSGGLKHRVDGRILELGLDKTSSAIQLVHGSNVVHG
ncbi:hypothetical protein Taro_053879, partial [Colocasia esculenta]|nr:hypothetical protein [Colocasia esculenta]